MENYIAVTQLNHGANKEENCEISFILDNQVNQDNQDDPYNITFFRMTFHWMDVESAYKQFGKLPDLIKRLNSVLLYGDTTYRTCIDNIQINISGNIIKLWIINTHYCTYH